MSLSETEIPIAAQRPLDVFDQGGIVPFSIIGPERRQAASNKALKWSAAFARPFPVSVMLIESGKIIDDVDEPHITSAPALIPWQTLCDGLSGGDQLVKQAKENIALLRRQQFPTDGGQSPPILLAQIAAKLGSLNHNRSKVRAYPEWTITREGAPTIRGQIKKKPARVSAEVVECAADVGCSHCGRLEPMEKTAKIILQMPPAPKLMLGIEGSAESSFYFVPLLRGGFTRLG